MAGNCFRQFWWWIPIAILSRCILPSSADSGRISCTSTYPSEVARERAQSDADVIVFLGERCDWEINVTEIQDHLERVPDAGELSISVMPRSRECITCTSTARDVVPDVAPEKKRGDDDEVEHRDERCRLQT